MVGKAAGRALCVALAGVAFGVSLGRTPIGHDLLSGMVLVVSLVLLISALLWTRSTVRGATQQSARQFLWSCVCVALISSSFGLAVATLLRFGPDFIHTFGVVFYGLILCVAIYPVRRDALRLGRETKPLGQ